MKISSSVVIFASADALFRAPKGKSRDFDENLRNENFKNFEKFVEIFEK